MVAATHASKLTGRLPAKLCRSRAAALPPQDGTDPWRLARLECRKKEASLVFPLSILQTILDATPPVDPSLT